MSAISHQQTILPRGKSVAVLSKAIQYEKKGDELTKLGKHELAQREYIKGQKIEEQYLGKNHSVVQELKKKIKSEQTTFKSTAQRKTMIALSQSIKHEKKGDYLLKAGRINAAECEYEQCLCIAQRVLGKDHPMVISLAQKYAATQPPIAPIPAVNDTADHGEVVSAVAVKTGLTQIVEKVPESFSKIAHPNTHDAVVKSFAPFEKWSIMPMPMAA